MKKISTIEASKHPNVKIAVRNFGPIAEGTVDLRPLTVFVGPSNTGKTYFSTLLYTLHRSFAGFPLVRKMLENISRHKLYNPANPIILSIRDSDKCSTAHFSLEISPKL